MTDKEIEDFVISFLRGFEDYIGFPTKEERINAIAKLKSFAKQYELSSKIVLEKEIELPVFTL